MASLHEALQCLGPTTWDEVPRSNYELREYLSDLFRKARLIIESVPEPPPLPSQIAASDASLSSSSSSTPSSQAASPGRDGGSLADPSSSAAAITSSTKKEGSYLSTARAGVSVPEMLAMQKEWGKPLKLNAKDNPLQLPMFSLKGHDGRGAWFGRRSLHDTLPFSQWKKKLSSEIEETYRVNSERKKNGLPADHSIRGIGAEDKLEEMEATAEDGKTVLGRVTVWRVSAQFPRPTTSRDFVTLVITSDVALDPLPKPGAVDGGAGKAAGKSFLIISKPCEHPDAPTDERYIRGQYESVEMIRELRKVTPSKVQDSRKNHSEIDLLDRGSSKDPAIHDAKTKTATGRKRGMTDSEVPEALHGQRGAVAAAADEEEEEEASLVEWVMVTRSDPGGNLPRWMVEKGTPKSIGTDAEKFLAWARQGSEEPEAETVDTERQAERAIDTGPSDSQTGAKSRPPQDGAEEGTSQPPQHHGLIASVASLLNAGIENYAPAAVRDYIPRPIYRDGPYDDDDDDEDSLSEDSDDSYDRASNDRTDSAAYKNKRNNGNGDGNTTDDTISLDSNPSLDSSIGMSNTDGNGRDSALPTELVATMKQAQSGGKLSSREKELSKLAVRRREVTAQLEAVRSKIDALQIPSDNNSTGASTTGPVLPKDSKAAAHLYRDESKLLKQLRKIEAHQIKAAAKLAARQQKQAEREERSRSRTETESLRREVHELRKEVTQLREERNEWIDLLGRLQAENTKMVAERQREREAQGKKEEERG